MLVVFVGYVLAGDLVGVDEKLLQLVMRVLDMVVICLTVFFCNHPVAWLSDRKVRRLQPLWGRGQLGQS